MASTGPEPLSASFATSLGTALPSVAPRRLDEAAEEEVMDEGSLLWKGETRGQFRILRIL